MDYCAHVQRSCVRTRATCVGLICEKSASSFAHRVYFIPLSCTEMSMLQGNLQTHQSQACRTASPGCPKGLFLKGARTEGAQSVFKRTEERRYHSFLEYEPHVLGGRPPLKRFHSYGPHVLGHGSSISDQGAPKTSKDSEKISFKAPGDPNWDEGRLEQVTFL
eukprot:1195212-Prorocentrum_minimum.AAC.6